MAKPRTRGNTELRQSEKAALFDRLKAGLDTAPWQARHWFNNVILDHLDEGLAKMRQDFPAPYRQPNPVLEQRRRGVTRRTLPPL